MNKLRQEYEGQEKERKRKEEEARLIREKEMNDKR